MLGAIQDITERKEAEEAARRAAEQAEVLLHVAARLNAELELDAVLHAILEATTQVLGVPIAVLALYDPSREMLDCVAERGIPPEHRHLLRPVPRTLFDAWIGAGRRIVVFPDVSAAIKPSNPALWAALDVNGGVMVSIVRRGQFLGALVAMIVGDVRQFSDDEVALVRGLADQAAQAITNARLFDQVRASGERLRRLTQQVVTVQEEERRHLSRELHDEAGQALTALEISLKLIHGELPPSATALRRRISDVIALAGTTMDQIRLLAQDLRPPALDALGLNLTLEGFCRSFAVRTDLVIDYVGTKVPALSDTINITLYRLLQEALTNVVKHARARRVRVTLQYDAEAIHLSIVDDGRGFDQQAALRGTSPVVGIGLVGMQERLALLGGELEIDSVRGQGTHVVARLPV
jgi:signal transduction histidine kinase